VWGLAQQLRGDSDTRSWIGVMLSFAAALAGGCAAVYAPGDLTRLGAVWLKYVAGGSVALAIWSWIAGRLRQAAYGDYHAYVLSNLTNCGVIDAVASIDAYQRFPRLGIPPGDDSLLARVLHPAHRASFTGRIRDLRTSYTYVCSRLSLPPWPAKWNNLLLALSLLALGVNALSVLIDPQAGTFMPVDGFWGRVLASPWIWPTLGLQLMPCTAGECILESIQGSALNAALADAAEAYAEGGSIPEEAKITEAEELVPRAHPTDPAPEGWDEAVHEYVEEAEAPPDESAEGEHPSHADSLDDTGWS